MGTGVFACAIADLLVLTGDLTAGFTVARELGLAVVFDIGLAVVFAATLVAGLLAGLVAALLVALLDDFTAMVFPFGLALAAVVLAAALGLVADFTGVVFAVLDLIVFADAGCFLAGFFIAVAMESSTSEKLGIRAGTSAP